MPTPSTAAQILVTVIPIVGIVMGSLVIFSYLLFNYKIKVHMIEKGLYSRTPFDMDTFSLLAGFLLLVLGLALMTFFLIKDGFSYGALSGLIPFSIGVSLLAFFTVRVKIKSKNAR